MRLIETHFGNPTEYLLLHNEDDSEPATNELQVCKPFDSLIDAMKTFAEETFFECATKGCNNPRPKQFLYCHKCTDIITAQESKRIDNQTFDDTVSEIYKSKQRNGETKTN